MRRLPSKSDRRPILEQTLLGKIFEMAGLGVLGILLTVLAQLRVALVGLVVAIVAIVGSFAASYYLFETEGYLIDPLYPAGTAFLIFVTATLIGYIRTEQEKAQVRGALLALSVAGAGRSGLAQPRAAEAGW